MINKYKQKNDDKLLNLLFKSKTFYGELKQKNNKSLRSFIYGIRHNYHIINLKYISIYLKRILKLIRNIVQNKQKILIIGNSSDISFLINKNLTKKNKYVIFFNEEWINGLITNNNISILKKNKYKIKLIIVIKSTLAVDNYLNTELLSLKIPLISLIGTNQDIKNINYPIVTNLKNIQSIYTYLYLIRKIF